jgi:RNA polymerase sigma-70 factor (family 1)
MPESNEQFLINGVIRGDRSIFSVVFLKYYNDLVMFAHTFLRDLESSEELVQDVFLRLWENRDGFVVTSSLKSYLLKSVQNKCIDSLRHLKIKEHYAHKILDNPVLFENDTDNYLLYSELQKDLTKALDKLPDDISKAFRLNRFDGLTYHEIADQLHVSERTIEVRIGKALAMLREILKDYLLTIIILFRFV